MGRAWRELITRGDKKEKGEEKEREEWLKSGHQRKFKRHMGAQIDETGSLQPEITH